MKLVGDPSDAIGNAAARSAHEYCPRVRECLEEWWGPYLLGKEDDVWVLPCPWCLVWSSSRSLVAGFHQADEWDHCFFFDAGLECNSSPSGTTVPPSFSPPILLPTNGLQADSFSEEDERGSSDEAEPLWLRIQWSSGCWGLVG